MFQYRQGCAIGVRRLVAEFMYKTGLWSRMGLDGGRPACISDVADPFASCADWLWEGKGDMNLWVHAYVLEESSRNVKCGRRMKLGP